MTFSLPNLHFILRSNLQCDNNIVKQQLLKIHKEQWKEEIWNKPKLRNDVQIKEDYYTGQSSILYVVSCELLEREVGRCEGISDQRRLCVFCDLGIVEDRFYFEDLGNHLFEKP